MDTVFFLISKIVWLIISPGSLLLLMMIAGLVLLYLGRLQAARILLSVPVLLFTLIALLPVDEWLGYPLESRFVANPALPVNIDGIIVLGGALKGRESVQWQQAELSDAAERYTALVTLARQYPQARLVVSGGSGEILNQEIRE
ncbi:MAG: hypothetical protein WD601_06760, partial [Pseudohongiellaceae bacterium]